MSALVFNAIAHTYTTASGVRLPSVTEILRETRISADFEAIAQSSPEMARTIELKRHIGSSLHADAHAFDDDDLDWATVDPRVAPYLEAWARYREDSGLVPLTRERIVHHPSLHYAGTLDGIFRTPAGREVLVDIKTGDPDDAGCRYQTAGYQLAYAIDHPKQAIAERWAVQLIPDRTIPYLVTPYGDWLDLQQWQAIVTTYYAQHARRRRAA